MKSSAPALELGTESEGEKVMRHGEIDLMRVGLAVAAMEDGERVFILETDHQARSRTGRRVELTPNRSSSGSPTGSSLNVPCAPSSRGAARQPHELSRGKISLRQKHALDQADFRLWHKADIPVVLSNVRFWG
jgi:hypothetical protein